MLLKFLIMNNFMHKLIFLQIILSNKLKLFINNHNKTHFYFYITILYFL